MRQSCFDPIAPSTAQPTWSPNPIEIAFSFPFNFVLSGVHKVLELRRRAGDLRGHEDVVRAPPVWLGRRGDDERRSWASGAAAGDQTRSTADPSA